MVEDRNIEIDSIVIAKKKEITPRVSIVQDGAERLKDIDPHYNGRTALLYYSTIFENGKFTDNQIDKARFIIKNATRYEASDIEDKVIHEPFFTELKERDVKAIGGIIQIFIDETDKINSREDLIKKLNDEREKWENQLSNSSFRNPFRKKREEKIQESIKGLKGAIDSLKS